ncbi:MAG: hypothetical protein IPK85_01940 [Gemmatimonadetes bacterium]|nr:hypothetical protein [Gemmatimonadota bacterium]
MTIDWKALAAPFPPDAVSWRVGSISKRDKTKAKALAYLDARDVMNRLDDVAGPANWQCRYSHAGAKTVCDIAIRVDGEWVWKADGAGDTDIEAEKGSLSDAFKRSAVRWGIGRYLYDLPSPWVTINEFKQIEDGEMPKLRALLARDARQPAVSPPPARPEPAPAHATAPSAPTETPRGWAYITVDGEIVREPTAKAWFDRLEADVRRLPPAKSNKVWALNEKVSGEVLDSLNSAVRPKAEAHLDRIMTLVSENTSPVTA